MKIIECIKEFPLIVKKMNANSAKIQEYASVLSIEVDLPFGTVEAQKKEVQSLVKANSDLADRYLKLARDLTFTNTQIKVEINGQTRSITEWLYLRGLTKGAQIATPLRTTYMSLNTTASAQKLKSGQVSGDISEKPLQILRCYDQKKADEMVSNIDETLALIDAKLEVVNATTEILEAI